MNEKSTDTGIALTRARMNVDRLVLLLVAVMSLLSILSWRYHYFIRNYGEFILRQALPASGMGNITQTPASKNLDKISGADFADFGNPYFSVPHYLTHDQPINRTSSRTPFASDYLGVWHFIREMLRGRNPFEFRGMIAYNNQTLRRDGYTVLNDPGVPDQIVGGGLSYFPMAPILLIPFYLPNYFASLILYLIVLHLFVLGLSVWFVRRSEGFRFQATILMATMLLTAYPLDFLVDRGNTEGVIFMILTAGLIAYFRGRYYLAAVLIGLAASAKLEPAVFFFLFLLDRRHGPFLTAFCVLVVSTLAAMLFMHESLIILAQQVLSNVSNFSVSIVGFDNRNMNIRFDHSIFNLVEGILVCLADHTTASAFLARFPRYYLLATLVSTTLILYGLRRAPSSNRLLVLTAVMLAFPYTSGDYKFIYIYLPFGVILLEIFRRGWATRNEVTACLLLAVLLAPKTYRLPFGCLKHYGVGFIINVILLIALIAFGLMAKFDEGISGERGHVKLD